MSTDRQSKLKRYLKKDYDRIIDFPVEIVGRDGVVRRYSFEEAVRFYLKRVASARSRIEDQELAVAEVAHCWKRIMQLRRSYSEHFAWDGMREALGPEASNREIVGEIAAFLHRSIRTDESRDRHLELFFLQDGDHHRVFSLRSRDPQDRPPEQKEPDLLLYIYTFDTEGPCRARDAFYQFLVALDSRRGAEGLEVLRAFHHTADCGLVLTMTGETSSSELEDSSTQGLDLFDADPGLEPFSEALLFHRKGDMERALQILDALLGRRPDHHQAALLATMSADALGQLELSEMYARMATHSSPQDGLSWYCLGLSLFRQERASEAEESLRKALGEVSSAGPARLLLSLLCWRRGERTRAAELLKAARGGGDFGRRVRLLELRLGLARHARLACLCLLLLALPPLVLQAPIWAIPQVILASIAMALSWWLGRAPDPRSIGIMKANTRATARWSPREPSEHAGGFLH